MSINDTCSPGSHPHADQRNWQPGDTDDDAPSLPAIDPGMSERAIAKLFGVPRVTLHRWKLMAEIPEDLFELLIKGGVRSTKQMAQIALAARGGVNRLAEVQCCPHCGGVLRVRKLISDKAFDIVKQWASQQNGEAA
jgi:hypothetical protein